MGFTRTGLFAGRGKLFHAVFADRLQHRETWLAVGAVHPANQALVDQRSHPVEDIALPVLGSGRHCRGRFQGKAADEDRQRPEEAPVLHGEKVIAPGDGVAHRALPVRLVARRRR